MSPRIMERIAQQNYKRQILDQSPCLLLVNINLQAVIVASSIVQAIRDRIGHSLYQMLIGLMSICLPMVNISWQWKMGRGLVVIFILPAIMALIGHNVPRH